MAGQPPNITRQPPSMDSGDMELQNDILSKLSSKAAISRSNSAPQSQNRFSIFKGNGKSSSPKNKQSGKCGMVNTSPQSFDSPLTILSDGVISVDTEQAVQAAAEVIRVASLHGQGSGDGNSMTGNRSQVSQVPLCDSNHSPSATRRCYNPQYSSTSSSEVFDMEPQPGDVWQRQDLPTSSLPSSASRSLSSSAVTNQTNGVHEAECTVSTTQNGAHQGRGNLQRTDAVSGDSPRDAADESCEPNSEDNDPAVMRGNSERRQVRHSQSEVFLPSDLQRKMSLAGVSGRGYARLAEELSKAQKALEMKDEEVDELRGIRERLMKEVSDFTASLFEEVNSQLNEAALSEQQARKQLKEANHKIEMMTAEVAALKKLVLTSTPAAPNKHLHPQINNGSSPTSSTQSSGKKEKGGKPFWMTHRRSTSHHQYTKESREKEEAAQHHAQLKEMDTVAYDEFARWRLQPTVDMSSPFFTRVQQDDIQPCLNFKNAKLADRLQQSVRENTLSIEPIPGDQSYPRKCSLSETHKLCNYKIRFEGDTEWFSISQMSRNRIAAVCDFYCYVRYIVQGLVKCSDKDMFAELVRLRHKMAQSRLGVI